MYLMRPSEPGDLDAILELARYLDSPNLPDDREFVTQRLERSVRAFGQPGPPNAEREYQFALEDETGRVVGTCAILSKHGTAHMPHLFLRVGEEVRRSRTAGTAMHHVTLQLGVSHDGPTEFGSLVLHPDQRGRPGRPGKLLSWGRFTYLARHRGCFEAHLLAEMRAALDDWGRSAFWDAFGRRFTDMSYADADRLSAVDKTFILDLFPDVPFYASLLDADVASQLGQVHHEALPALRLLEGAGLSWIGEIDPFDGGPFVGAPVDDVIPVRETRAGMLAEGSPAEDATLQIVSTEEGGRFRAVIAPAEPDGGDRIRITKDACKRLLITPGDELALTPLPPRRTQGEDDG